MKKIIALILCAAMLFTACGKVNTQPQATVNAETVAVSAEPTAEIAEATPELTAEPTTEPTIEPTTEPTTDPAAETLAAEYLEPQYDSSGDEEQLAYLNQFTDLDDPNLLQCVSDEIYTALEADLYSDDYIVEDVNAIYISKEYLEEVAYNSQSNIFFGYTLADIEAQFDGGKYVFTLGDDNQTIVTEFEDYDDTYERIVKNVAIGAGVILVCVTVSAVTGGAGTLPAVSMVFAASAKTGAIMALSFAGIGGVAAGIVKGIQTKNFDEATKAAALVASEGFKWGAITGVITGGFSKALELRKAAKVAETAADMAGKVANTNTIPTPREAEIQALEKYGGTEQISYLGGKQVAMNTPGATRPDIVRQVGDHLEAIEVKNYNLESSASRNTLYKELVRQISQRVDDLPTGTMQRIVLNTKGRGFSQELIDEVIENIRISLKDIYSNIPIDVMG